MQQKFKIGLVIVVIGIIGVLVIGWLSKEGTTPPVAEECVEVYEDVVPKKETFYKYGLPVDSFELVKSKVRRNQFFSDILTHYGLTNQYILNITQRFKDVFDIRRLRTSQPYTIFLNKACMPHASYFVYEINDIEYVVYDFDNDTVFTGDKETYVQEKIAQGVVESSLYLTLDEQDANPLLALEMADIFAWVIDFYRLQKGDRFKVIYHENFVEGKSTGIDKIVASVFKHQGTDYYAFYFKPDSVVVGNYFDEKGESLRKTFLKAPLKYSRISSGFSRRRFHPVLKRYKAHLGVDYAAPTGTPIRAVGDGTVIEAQYKKYNGNYVKIQHNSTYSTQYLHMSGFAEGIKRGAKVIQGQVIGYVGSTGLATGPHVCFRFWKNGVQVNPFKIKIPPAKPVEDQYLDQYNQQMAKLKDELDKLAF